MSVLDATLIRCSQCGYRRFDPVAESCERRTCAYTAYCGVKDCPEPAKYWAADVKLWLCYFHVEDG